ncbi:MAG: Mrp/NBP35 family ATP-binding protein [Candidatus Latescibacterota bacterium]|nr:Mrp/NBP35 family ATP-binding protein [Candidatus Latescibacterota bacterium]
MTTFPRTMPEDLDGPLRGVRNAVAIASAKGGVGKSTVASNLALASQQLGARVGLMDGDIYGPSLPLLMGVREQPEITPEDRLIPIDAHGLSVMSMGFIADENTPVVWRGPLLAQAVQQFLHQVEWGELDILYLDLPPGTGDIPLTISQAIALSGAVIVTTPQDVALEDVERGIAMFDKVDIEVLGLVENMSYYLCPHCSQRHPMFGEGGGRGLAQKLDVEFLGEVPLDPMIRAAGDEGKPLLLHSADAPHNQTFSDIAERVANALTSLA